MSQIDFAKTDFVVFNGDMVSFSLNEDQIFSGFMDTAVSVFAKEIPMYYARGNHETQPLMQPIFQIIFLLQVVNCIILLPEEMLFSLCWIAAKTNLILIWNTGAILIWISIEASRHNG